MERRFRIAKIIAWKLVRKLFWSSFSKRDGSHSTDDDLVERYVTILETGHDEECLWRQAGCKDDIYRLPIARPSTWQSQLRERYLSFASTTATTTSLSAIRIMHPLHLAETINTLPKSILFPPESATTAPSTDIQPPPPTDPDPTALAFALLGWSCASTDATYPVATCTTCFRRLGLWLYTSPTPTSSPLPATEPPPPKMELDLLANHREYCPWVNATSQRSPGSFTGLAAWQILLKLIRNSAVEPAQQAGSRVRAVSNGTESGSARSITATEAQMGASDGAISEEPLRDSKRQETVEKEDKARFARLKELTKSMTFKSRGLRSKLSGKGGVDAGAGSGSVAAMQK